MDALANALGTTTPDLLGWCGVAVLVVIIAVLVATYRDPPLDDGDDDHASRDAW